MMIALYLFLFLILGTACLAAWKGAPWVPTRKGEIQHILEILPDLSGKHVVDIGCGTGSILFALAKKYPRATFQGIELSLGPLFIAFLRKQLHGNIYKNIRLQFGSFYKADLSKADVIISFIMAEPHNRIAHILGPTFAKNAIVLFEGWPPADFPPRKTHKRSGCLSFYEYRGSDFSE